MVKRENSRAALERRIMDAALTGTAIRCLWQWGAHTDTGMIWDVWLWLGEEAVAFQARGVLPEALFDQHQSMVATIEPKLARLIVRKMWKQRWHPSRD